MGRRNDPRLGTKSDRDLFLVMRLVELEPHWVRYEWGVAPPHIGKKLPDGQIQWGGFPQQVVRRVDNFADAQGIWFLCPVCFQKNEGAVGTHSCEVTFEGRGAKDDEGSHTLEGAPSRWAVTGSTFEDLSTHPSIFLNGPGCGWHGYITNGEVT